MKIVRWLSAALLLVALSGLPAAQTARTLRLVVPFPPGGSADVLARQLSLQIGQNGGPTVVVENRPGGGTVIATDVVARAAPDGNTVLLMANSFVINASVRATLPYDPLTSFAPVCLIVDSPQILVVNAASPFNTLADFVAAARANPGSVNYATVGPATTQHIAVEMFRRLAGIELTYVPYAGGGPAMTALIGGHVMAVLANPSEVMEQIVSGKVRALGVATRERFSLLPHVRRIKGDGTSQTLLRLGPSALEIKVIPLVAGPFRVLGIATNRFGEVLGGSLEISLAISQDGQPGMGVGPFRVDLQRLAIRGFGVGRIVRILERLAHRDLHIRRLAIVDLGLGRCLEHPGGVVDLGTPHGLRTAAEQD